MGAPYRMLVDGTAPRIYSFKYDKRYYLCYLPRAIMKGGYSRQRSVLYVSFTILLCKKKKRLVSIILFNFRLYVFKNCCQFINMLCFPDDRSSEAAAQNSKTRDLFPCKKSLKAFNFFLCSHSRSLFEALL